MAQELNLQERLTQLEQVAVIRPGRNVIPHETIWYTHLPYTCIAAWWYHPCTGHLDYSTDATAPWEPWDGGYFAGWQQQRTGWLPGLVFRSPTDGKVYVAVFCWQFGDPQRALSGAQLQKMLQQVVAACAVEVADVVDDEGNSLLQDGCGRPSRKHGKLLLPNALELAHALEVPLCARRPHAPTETLAEALERVERLPVIEHGWNVLDHETELYLHLPPAAVGSWWYDTQHSLLEFSMVERSPFPWDVNNPQAFSVTRHWIEECRERWIPGWVFHNPQDGKLFLAVHSCLFEQGRTLSGATLKHLVQQVLVAFDILVEDVLDAQGNSMVRTR